MAKLRHHYFFIYFTLLNLIHSSYGQRYDIEDDSNLNELQKLIREIQNAEGEYDPMTTRIQPNNNDHYAISMERLDEIRQHLMYPYYDIDFEGKGGDLQRTINAQNSQINKQLTFLLPFFGFGLNYTWVSLNGYLGFSDAPFNWRNYPLQFPIPQWPILPDPSFIAPFYSKCNIGMLKPGAGLAQKTPGVYWRLERDLPERQDQLGVEIRERLKWDIREGIVGSEIFEPKHAIIVTWKNVTFSGGSVNTEAKHITNTFQLIVITDEVRTYAMFNYEHMKWVSHTEAGGSSDDGQGGVPAFVGFNAGNGTRAYEYTPYSQSLYIRDLAVSGYANGKPGRHIFRIDEVVLAGTCRREETLQSYPLVFSPEYGNMLGGTIVNVTGPCFEKSYRVSCQFDSDVIEGYVFDQNTAFCMMPRLYVSGYVDIGLSINGGPFLWKGKFYVETPITATEGVWFPDKEIVAKEPEFISLQWLSGNLTQRRDATVTISLWGYREINVLPELIYIDVLAEGITNDDRETIPYSLATEDFANRDNSEFINLEMGFIMINLTEPEPTYLHKTSSKLWSQPIPLAWYFRYQWERYLGKTWPTAMCDRWTESDRNLRNFAYEVDRCPCLLSQAVSDKGRFLPDFSCDKDGNTECYYYYAASHCVRSGLPNKDGAGQQCCYDREGYLMLTSDQMWGGHPFRAHNFGQLPYDQSNKVPSLSHYYHDVIPLHSCCMWQSEQSPGCVNFRYERRASQDCVGYTPPGGATVFGDPHIYTFDGLQYTFNGLGEFVLVRVDSPRHHLDVQGRFEIIPQNYFGYAKGSMLTSVAAKDNVSSVVEVRMRPPDAMWRYHLDVIVDGRRVYFDRYSQKVQQFQECVIYTPRNILNQSQVIVMFSSGAGVEVIENRGYLGLRVYLPLTFANITSGLFGNWTFDPSDDFLLPDGSMSPTVDTNNLEVIHDEFGMKWVVDDKEDPNKGRSLFYHEPFRSSNYYYHPQFQPEFDPTPELLGNSSFLASAVTRVCGDSYQCKFDFATTLRKDFALTTKYFQDQYVNIKEDGLSYVLSCGALETPPNGRKSTFSFISGAEVKFDCDPGYVLLGEQERHCYASGDWNLPESGEAVCITEDEYMTMQNGIVAGMVLAIVVPLFMALVCFIIYCRKRVKIHNDAIIEEYSVSSPPNGSIPKMAADPIPLSTMSTLPISEKMMMKKEPTDRTDFPLPPPTVMRPADDFDSSSTASSTSVESDHQPPPPFPERNNYHHQHQGNLSSFQSGGVEKSYYTQEPVNDKPVVFPNMLWGIEDRRSSSSPSSSLSPNDTKKRPHTPSTSQESAV